MIFILTFDKMKCFASAVPTLFILCALLLITDAALLVFTERQLLLISY